MHACDQALAEFLDRQERRSKTPAVQRAILEVHAAGEDLLSYREIEDDPEGFYLAAAATRLDPDWVRTGCNVYRSIAAHVRLPGDSEWLKLLLALAGFLELHGQIPGFVYHTKVDWCPQCWESVRKEEMAA